MTYFPDLSPYRYGHGSHPGVVHVAWLDGVHDFARGTVDRHIIEKLKRLARKPVELYRGVHICEVCVEPPSLVKDLGPNRVISPECSWYVWARQRSSNGEIRVSRQAVTYAAPLLIIHHIEEHQYLPPSEFLKAVEEVIEPGE